jgi:hypothetical protein
MGLHGLLQGEVYFTYGDDDNNNNNKNNNNNNSIFTVEGIKDLIRPGSNLMTIHARD